MKIFLILLAFFAVGCSSIYSRYYGGPRSVYPGVKEEFSLNGHSPLLAIIDLSFSFVLDTIMLPFDVIHLNKNRVRNDTRGVYDRNANFIGETIEVTGIINKFYGSFYEINTDCLKVNIDAKTLEGAAFPEKYNCNKKSRQSYNIGVGDELMSTDEKKEKWEEKLQIESFVGKTVKMQAKIHLCDECRRHCDTCNVCCVFYLEPLNIELLGNR